MAATISRTLFVGAMAGLGLGVDARNVRRVGPRVATTVLATTGFMVVLALAGTELLDLKQ